VSRSIASWAAPRGTRCPSTRTAGTAGAARPRTSPRGRARSRGQGFRGLKFDPFGAAHGTLDVREEALSLEIVAAVREAVGPTVELMIEAHDRFDVPTAIRVGRALEPHRIAWYEAPVHSNDLEALARVAGAVPVPVAAGERLSQPADFARLGRSRTVLIWQPETLSIGGVTGIQQVSAIAAAYGASIAPHNARGPVCTTVNAHLAAWLRTSASRSTSSRARCRWPSRSFPARRAWSTAC
jgi:galactonate dehydratase